MKNKAPFNPKQSAKIIMMDEKGNVLGSRFDSFDSIKHASVMAGQEKFATTFSLSQENGHYSIHNI